MTKPPPFHRNKKTVENIGFLLYNGFDTRKPIPFPFPNFVWGLRLDPVPKRILGIQ
jgi:hypothetical protein